MLFLFFYCFCLLLFCYFLFLFFFCFCLCLLFSCCFFVYFTFLLLFYYFSLKKIQFLIMSSNGNLGIVKCKSMITFLFKFLNMSVYVIFSLENNKFSHP